MSNNNTTIPLLNKPIVHSLLADDLYKFTMQQVMFHRHPGAHAVYEFTCRNMPEFPLSELYQAVEKEIEHLCTLKFTEDEIDYLETLGYFKQDYLDFLRDFQLKFGHIEVYAKGEHLHIVAEGPQIYTMKFEIFCLYIVSELYFRRFTTDDLLTEARRRLGEKIALIRDYQINQPNQLHPYVIYDGGLRRRAFGSFHDELVARFVTELPGVFQGTSNVYLAKKYGIRPIGTAAHEYFQSYQAYSGVNLYEFQKVALQDWLDEYQGEISIALTDTIGMGPFLRDFNRCFSRAFDGMRHDSSDPYAWGDAAINHYLSDKIDVNPHNKRLVFSNSLDIPKTFELHKYFGNRAPTPFLIGTNFTNDTGKTPLNIVMKLIELNGRPVAKLSDEPGKSSCKDPLYVEYLKHIYKHYPA